MKRSKGFTLIELLAVIVILAVIALIAVPQVLKILNKARLSAAEDTTYGIVKSAENYVTEFMLQNNGSFASSELEFKCENKKCELQNTLENYNIEDLTNLEFKGTKPTSGIVTISDNGKTVVAKDLIINGFTCNYPVDGKAKCNGDGIGSDNNDDNIEESTPGEEKIDTTAPDVAPTFNATATTNSITVNIAKEAEDTESGIYGYQFTADGGSTWYPIAPQDSKTYTFYGLASGSYEVNVRAINKTYPEKEIDETNTKEGTVQTVSTSSLGSITEATSTPSGYAQSKNVLVNFEGNGVYLIKPSVNVKTNVEAILCTSVDSEYSCTETVIPMGETLSPGENVWYKVASSPTLIFTSNGSVSYKVVDGNNTTDVGVTTVTGIDIDVPDSATFTVTGKTASSITVKAGGTDTESGIYGYQFSKDGGNTWLPASPQTSEVYTFTGLTAGTYTIKIRAINGTYLNNGINELNTLESNIDTSSNVTITTTTKTTTRATYTLSYNVNGGTGSISSQSALSGNSVTVTSSTPTRSGYTFLGWSKSSTATTASYTSGNSITLTSNVTLYAVWEKVVTTTTTTTKQSLPTLSSACIDSSYNKTLCSECESIANQVVSDYCSGGQGSCPNAGSVHQSTLSACNSCCKSTTCEISCQSQAELTGDNAYTSCSKGGGSSSSCENAYLSATTSTYNSCIKDC